MPQRTLGNMETFLIVMIGREGAADFQWVEAGDAAKHATIHRTASHKRSIWPKMSAVLRLRNMVYRKALR